MRPSKANLKKGPMLKTYINKISEAQTINLLELNACLPTTGFAAADGLSMTAPR